jgi:hypothetical protein
MNDGEEHVTSQQTNHVEERKAPEAVEENKQKKIPKNDNFERINHNEYGKRRSYEYEDV